jgi:hypothetical protein
MNEQYEQHVKLQQIHRNALKDFEAAHNEKIKEISNLANQKSLLINKSKTSKHQLKEQMTLIHNEEKKKF